LYASRKNNRTLIISCTEKNEKRKSQPTKARVWLPFPANIAAQPHTTCPGFFRDAFFAHAQPDSNDEAF